MVQACGGVIAACTARSVSCGLHLVYPKLEDLQRELTGGCTFLVLGSDIFNLSQRSIEVDAMIDAVRTER